MEWLTQLQGHVVGLDTAPLIYFDAIQIATALREGATFFLTNDIRLAAVPDLEVLVLDTFLNT
ncbi:MAG: hypothetical protein ACLFV6_17885 [Spirulinaceae cyanobacterium]